MEYTFREFEKKWQQIWAEQGTYCVSNDSVKPKYYVLDMFPYPSGTGLHVGHPLGYISSDIFARYMRLKGYNVLHPMGFDAFGLPAEQFALESGQHPALTTRQNISTFRRQLDRIGLGFDWSREVQTCDPSYYRWTQWIFLQLFHSWFNRRNRKAESITRLEDIFAREGNGSQSCPGDQALKFSARDWMGFGEKQRQDILMHYRLAYCGYGEVNWCEALGTVLANDEVINGLSERGGHPVVRRKLRQWYLRITEYGDRLLEGLSQVEFSESMKEMQTNWIGKSTGAEIEFRVSGSPACIRVFTTRPDTLFGVDFLVLAPEHPLVGSITSPDQSDQVSRYLGMAQSRSERERMAEKRISGCFTGAYGEHPFTKKQIPIWIAEYVLSGYGTGAIMGVPCGDERDHRFAQYFRLPVTNILGPLYGGGEANPTHEAILENSGFLDGMSMNQAFAEVISRLEQSGQGNRKIQYKMRDAAFSRQRYWGEPFPIIWENGIARSLADSQLPLRLPHVDRYRPGPEGEGPLANLKEWTSLGLETNTMPGYAGSSWYFLRYMDPHNQETFCDRKASDYWGQVDLYIGGTEHAVGHLLYSRMWTKVLHDLGYIGHDEPYRKLMNQGMIQGSSRRIYRLRFQEPEGTRESGRAGQGRPVLISNLLRIRLEQGQADIRPLENALRSARGATEGNNPIPLEWKAYPLAVDIHIVDGLKLDIEAFRKWKPEYRDALFIRENGDPEQGDFLCEAEVEKMSKSKFNTVNPEEIMDQYGADTFRMYEMFLGPVESSKPWDTKGIEGVHRFLKKFWRLFFDDRKGWMVSQEAPGSQEIRILHRTIKKIREDTESFSLNTAVSQFMICVNELGEYSCRKRAILEPLLVLLAPYAPHICEELWQGLGHSGTIMDATLPEYDPDLLREALISYPVAINGKTRTEIRIGAGLETSELESRVLEDEVVRKWLGGKAPKRIIVVRGRMINIVV